MIDQTHSPPLVRSTRRTFLGLAATATFALSSGRHVRAQPGDSKPPVTGNDNVDLVPFDQLMASFIEEQKVPGASLSVTRNSKLVYARGFGYADVEKKEPVQPAALCRIGSISKTFTAVAIMQLVESGKLKLDDRVFDHIKLKPFVAPGSKPDPRWQQITVRNCLQHTGGWDEKKGFDPTDAPEVVAKALGIGPAVAPDDIVRYMMGKPLDFDPGQRVSYSSFGYLVLGRVLEAATGQPYESHVKKAVLAPLGIKSMQLGRALLENRAKGEMKYYDRQGRTGPAIYPPKIGEQVPIQYGVRNFEGYDGCGGWIASAVELVKFASAFDDPNNCPLLNAASIEQMWARPKGPLSLDADGKPKPWFYACGWIVGVVENTGKVDAAHGGMVAGAEAFMLRRSDKLCWAMVFNMPHQTDSKYLFDLLGPRLDETADKIKAWPNYDLFGELLT